jgi:hypothetical protein
MTIIRLSNRIARLERRRRNPTPDRQCLAEVTARLIEATDAAHDLDEILAFRAEIAAARRSVGS